jgi:hypothetical protein
MHCGCFHAYKGSFTHPFTISITIMHNPNVGRDLDQAAAIVKSFLLFGFVRMHGDGTGSGHCGDLFGNCGLCNCREGFEAGSSHYGGFLEPLGLCATVGRELEQAAAHALAAEGGVSQDTPDTAPLQRSNGRQNLEVAGGNGAVANGDVAVANEDTEMLSQEVAGDTEAVRKPTKAGGTLPPSRLSNGSRSPAPWR